MSPINRGKEKTGQVLENESRKAPEHKICKNQCNPLENNCDKLASKKPSETRDKSFTDSH
jgi:hypothetical protein